MNPTLTTEEPNLAIGYEALMISANIFAAEFLQNDYINK